MVKNYNSTFSERIITLKQRFASGNRAEMARLAGLKESAARKYEQGLSEPGLAALQKLAEAFKVDINWLLSGKGTMTPAYESAASQETYAGEESVSYASVNYINVPLVQQYAYAGYLAGFADPEYMDELPRIPFPANGPAKGNYIAFEIRGDSMYDGSPESYDEGEIALCREIAPVYWTSKLHTHKWKDYIIVHRDEGVLLKRILNHDPEAGIITCHSLNDMYEDFELHLKDVMQLFNVIKTVKNR